MAPTVTPVVLHWNNYEDTAECLDSLLALSYPLEIVVVDNGSTDGSGERLVAEYDVVVELLDENRGFAGGMNHGIRVGRQRGAEYLWLLNNDILVQSDGVVEGLVAQMENDDELGIVSPLVRTYPNTDGVWFERGRVDPRSGEPIHDTGHPTDQSGLIDDEYIPLCAAMIRAEAVATAGFLPEELFLYYEDVAFADALRAEGYRLVTDPSVEVYHKVGGSSDGSLGPLFSYYLTRNVLLYHRRQSTREFSEGAYARWVLLSLLQRIANGRLDSTWAVIRGVVDGFRGRTGRGPYP